MNRRPWLFFGAGAVALTFVQSRALAAEPEAPVRGVPIDERNVTTYEFDDDPLSAGLPYTPIIHVRERAATQTVVRPRTSFVVRLVRSVEEIGDPYPPAVRM